VPERSEERADSFSALAIDLYQLTMAQAYLREGLTAPAVFSLHYRTLPPTRNYVLACGLADALAYLESLRFTAADLDTLSRLGEAEPAPPNPPAAPRLGEARSAPPTSPARPRLGGFRDDFLRWLETFRFAGSVWAMPEGTPVFPGEPLLEIEASLPQAQLVETVVMNQVHLQSVLASKAARVVAAAAGRPVIDFGMRRIHGLDAAAKAVRAFYVAGVDATSNVAAGNRYGVPVSGTMAHSYIQAHDDEASAFRELSALYPDTVLLVDTYDTLDGVRNVIRLARLLGSDFRVRGIRLDSGDLGVLAREARNLLDAAGLSQVRIVASGGLDENEIASLLAQGAPIDSFGVGTRMGASVDAPTLDMAYKLTAYAGQGRLKLSPGKRLLPGRKQVFRLERAGAAEGDVLARADEARSGRPLLSLVMEGGVRTTAGRVSLAEARERAREETARLPPRLRALERAEPPYPVVISEALAALEAEVARRAAGAPQNPAGRSS
jgi:nicotinate phosphoribosyltransferase